jgi:hypothetical protein
MLRIITTDKTTDISKGNDGTYYVTEYGQERDFSAVSNPFKEKEANDIERIADALVGSLKDHVVVKENTDGVKNSPVPYPKCKSLLCLMLLPPFR